MLLQDFYYTLFVKASFGRIYEMPKVREHVIESIERGVYDPELIKLYDEEEYAKLESFIDHDRDYLIYLRRSSSGG